MSGRWTSANSGPDYRAGDDKPVTLAEFLAARLDEDEAAAREFVTLLDEVQMQNANTLRHRDAVTSYLFWQQDRGRLLRDVAAKRAILARHHVIMRDDNPVCAWCSGSFLDDVALYAPCPDLLDLAAIWSDHPDYNPAWRPQ